LYVNKRDDCSRRDGKLIRYIEKNVKGMSMQRMCVYEDKEEERRKENEIKCDK